MRTMVAGVLALGLFACGGDVVDSDGLIAPSERPMCVEPELPVGDLTRQAFLLKWYCDTQEPDDGSPSDGPRACTRNDNPWMDATELEITIDPSGPTGLRLLVGGHAADVYPDPPGLAIEAGNDGIQRRRPGYIDRCTADSLVLSVAWRTADETAWASWYAVATSQ